MKPFNLEEYIAANPLRKAVTREGRNARIICTNRKVDSYTNCTIVALVEIREGYEMCICFTKNGKYIDGFESPYDLFFVQEKKEGWINIYKGIVNNRLPSIMVYKTKEEAIKSIFNQDCHIDTIKIEWEE